MQTLIFFKNSCLLLICCLSLFFTACTGGGAEEQQATTDQENTETQDNADSAVSPEIDALANPMQVKGVGPIQEIELGSTIDEQMAQQGGSSSFLMQQEF
ncbi:hypothetical protein OKW21_006713 [Catalinimonas alkaloidigena]|uniref:hypothetical protein n=1 Tax=Catalinimonas alkaloidigena TaxID=1075417 RepID=UPI002405BD4C|nr:hypothetical protein [Catalinimonas alkaloidigena]MDF9801404.1 hypothetical protein [Catalinimonas alkaloidigena]